MKNAIIAIFLCSLIGSASQAQIIRGGLNFANVSNNGDGNFDEANMLSSWQVGLIGDWKLLPMIYLQPGIVFTGKGSKTQDGNESDATFYRATTNPYYIEIPATLVLKVPGPLKFFAGMGPYIAIGVSGKNTVDGKILGAGFHSEENIKWSDDDPSTLDYEEGAGLGVMKRFDYGLNFTAGLQFTKLVLGLNYGHGCAKLQSGSDSGDDDANKHRVFSVTLGIKL